MVCASIWEDNPRALASGLSSVQTQTHAIIATAYICTFCIAKCIVSDVKHGNINERCNLIIHIRISCKSHSELSIFSPWLACADPENFIRGGPTLTIFLVDEGRENPNTT